MKTAPPQEMGVPRLARLPPIPANRDSALWPTKPWQLPTTRQAREAVSRTSKQYRTSLNSKIWTPANLPFAVRQELPADVASTPHDDGSQHEPAVRDATFQLSFN